MRKLLSIIGFLIFSTAAYAGSVNVGFTGAIMNIDVGGTETEVGTATKTNSNSEVSSGGASHNGVPIASVYLEFQGEDASWAGEGNGWAVGVKHTPGTADVSENVKTQEAWHMIPVSVGQMRPSCTVLTTFCQFFGDVLSGPKNST